MIDRYCQHLLANPRLLAGLPELRDQPLANWRRHEGEPRTEANACHADVLLELVDTQSDADLRAGLTSKDGA